jgi:hypothetical protein
LPGYAERVAQKRLRSRRAETYERVGFYQPEFGIEPWPARLNLRRTRLFVDTPLSPFRRRPFEVLDHIGDVDILSLDPCRQQCFVEQLAGRPYEWMAT